MMVRTKPPGTPTDSSTLDASSSAVGVAGGVSRGSGNVTSGAGSTISRAGSKKTSTPRFRIALDTSPWRGSIAKKSRKFGCALTTRGSPLIKPHSFTKRKPSGSRSGFNRSSTVGEHRFAFSSSTHSPLMTAFKSTPSTHSNLPASGDGPGAHAD